MSWCQIILCVLLGVVTILMIGLSIQGCCNHRTGTTETNPDKGIVTNMLAMMGLQQPHATRNIGMRYDNASQLEEDQRLHDEGGGHHVIRTSQHGLINCYNACKECKIQR
jgi:hypothetical protein